MKFITFSIFTFFFCQNCVGQTSDTIRVYVYQKSTDSWKIEIKNDKIYSLYNSLVKRNDFTTKDQCVITDTTFQFLCDTSKLENKNLVKDGLRKFSNIPFILTGDIFGRRKNFFIPRNIHYESDDSLAIPTGIYARYYRSDGFVSNIIELKQDKTYRFYNHSCVADSQEKGTWSLDKDMIIFIPGESKRSMLDGVTKDRKLHLAEDYLIGEKTATIYTKARKAVVTETYLYLSKESTTQMTGNGR